MYWPHDLALTRGVVVAGGLDKGLHFPLSVLLSPTHPGNGANKALSQGQEGRHEAGMQ